MKTKTTALALLIAATCSLGSARQAWAGKGLSAIEEDLQKAALVNEFLKQQKQQPAPAQETPPPPPPPPRPPR